MRFALAMSLAMLAINPVFAFAAEKAAEKCTCSQECKENCKKGKTDDCKCTECKKSGECSDDHCKTKQHKH